MKPLFPPLPALRRSRLAPLVLTVLAACLGTASADHEAGARSPNLAVILKDRESLCYDAVVIVDGESDPAWERAAETRMKLLLSGLGLPAFEMDGAKECTRVLLLGFELDNLNAPGIYNGRLSVETTRAVDVSKGLLTPLNVATVWDAGRWGGKEGVYTSAQAQALFKEVQDRLFASFKRDYADSLDIQQEDDAEPVTAGR